MLTQELYVCEKLREFEAARLSRLAVTATHPNPSLVRPLVLGLGRVLVRAGEALIGPVAADAEGFKTEPGYRQAGVAGQSGSA